MFVFFFKQKTAYEMRISDWSSDVCSSDLLWSNPAFGHFGGIGSEVVNLAFLAGGLFLLHKRLFSWHAPVGMLAALVVMSLVFWNGSEIGRASCRERVCQYV